MYSCKHFNLAPNSLTSLRSQYISIFILVYICMCLSFTFSQLKMAIRYHTRTNPELLKCISMLKCLFCLRFNSIFIFVLLPVCLVGLTSFSFFHCFYVSQSKEFQIQQIWRGKLKWTHTTFSSQMWHEHFGILFLLLQSNDKGYLFCHFLQIVLLTAPIYSVYAAKDDDHES